ncbi:hypothetical protein Asi03nite_28760 [Actinoplanes siamensis]|uniref:Uncharacterized protein n=1 Tax=Actinoplanes siamensis TaxID=1223317 RepID=A0A919N6G6_9ACTN|nr:hypothetical protein Asi03nite_28760 [Actinoplanes siamensis]
MDGHPHATDPDPVAAPHGTADTLLNELTERYQAERRESKGPLGLDEALARTGRLIPHTPAPAPLAIQFTGSGPRLGRWWTRSRPVSRPVGPGPAGCRAGAARFSPRGGPARRPSRSPRGRSR